MLAIRYSFIFFTFFKALFTQEQGHDLYYHEKVLEHLLENYNTRIYPASNGNQVQINVSVLIHDMIDQPKANNYYGIEIFLKSQWRDMRLRYNDSNKQDTVTLSGESVYKIWTPDFFFEQKSGSFGKLITTNALARIFPNGLVRFSERLILKIFCAMNYTLYPFDSQMCSLLVMSYAYDNKYLKLNWNRREMEKFMKRYKSETILANGYDVDVEKLSINKESRLFSITGEHDVLKINFHLKRKYSEHLIRVYIPLVFIVAVSFTAFWIDYRSMPARTIVATLSVLAVSGFTSQVNLGHFPKDIIRSMDIYLCSCFLFVFATLVEYALVQTIDIKVRIMERERQTMRNDKKEQEKVMEEEPGHGLDGELKEESEESEDSEESDESEDSEESEESDESEDSKESGEGSEEECDEESEEESNKDGNSSGTNTKTRDDNTIIEEDGRIKAAKNKRDGHENEQSRLRRKWILEKAIDRLYEEHAKNRHEYHILDKISKRAFPILFIMMNVIYVTLHRVF